MTAEELKARTKAGMVAYSRLLIEEPRIGTEPIEEADELVAIVTSSRKTAKVCSRGGKIRVCGQSRIGN